MTGFFNILSAGIEKIAPIAKIGSGIAQGISAYQQSKIAKEQLKLAKQSYQRQVAHEDKQDESLKEASEYLNPLRKKYGAV